MSFSIVARIGFDADATHTRGERKRPAATPQRRKPADPAPVEDQVLEADANDGEDNGAGSTAGLSILAQALAAYSQNER